jgi:hypothetical protein
MSLNQSLRTLEPGDSVYVWEGEEEGYKLTSVTNVTPTRIKVQRYNTLAFNRDTGKALTNRYKYLCITEQVENEQCVTKRKEKLAALIDCYSISEKQFEKCYEALKRILGE